MLKQDIKSRTHKVNSPRIFVSYFLLYIDIGDKTLYAVTYGNSSKKEEVMFKWSYNHNFLGGT